MENQHRKINGYRDLSQEEIDLMNRIKAKGAELLELQSELLKHVSARQDDLEEHRNDSQQSLDEYLRFLSAEPLRWSAIGKTDIQTGIMALVRAIAQPSV